MNKNLPYIPVRVAAARGLGELRGVQEGVDAGQRTVVAAGGAQGCPYNAHVRILSGSAVPDSRGLLAGPGASHRVRALPGEIR